MKGLALRGTLRQWLVRLHRWSGLVIMTGLLVAGSTGTWLVFRPEIDRQINAHERIVEPAGTALPPDDLVARVEARFPDAWVSTLNFQRRPDDAVLLYLRSRGTAPPAVDQVFINPYTGEILGQRDSARLTLSKESLDRLVLRLHYSLLLKGWGSWLMGIAAVIWLVSNLIGLALAWPQAWRRAWAWWWMLAPPVGGGTVRTNHDLHRAGGLWLFPVLTVLAFTSVALNAPQFVRPVVNALSPLTRAEPGEKVSPADAVVTFGEAAAAVQSALPPARVANIYRDLSNGRHSVYFHLPGDVNPQGDNFAFVDLRSGAVTGLRRPAQLAAGDRFMSWIFPLHTGAAFGLPGRIVVAVTGVVVVLLNVTGLAMWWLRRRGRSARRYSAACDRLQAPAAVPRPAPES